MIDPHEYAQKQSELTAEFATYLLEHPEIDDALPEDSYIFFEVFGDLEFNDYSRRLAARRAREEGMTVVCVRVRGLAPPQGSRLLDPEIDPSPNVVQGAY
jgi:hypothetical protein